MFTACEEERTAVSIIKAAICIGQLLKERYIYASCWQICDGLPTASESRRRMSRKESRPMKSHVRVAVIGGGVVGCSILYHLTKLGWSDVALIERKELTAGSSWHAAGGFHALNSDPGIAKLQSYTIELYREIEHLSEQSVGMHMTGGINIAGTDKRWEFLRADHARHRVLGLETELLTPSEIKDLCPLIDVRDVRGALFDSHEGHVDPSGATYAYAKAAQLAGAQIYRHTRVMDLKPSGRGSWRVITDKGEIEAEHVVNAAGLWAREMGAMVGVQLPLIPMEHHYLITEDIPEIVAATKELPLILDLDAEIYMRQERNGMLVGVYEKDATPWAVNGTPWEYGETELLPPELDRLADALIKGYQRFPAVAEAGIKRIINGPFTFAPDGNPLVGPVPGVPNYWSACGVMAASAFPLRSGSSRANRARTSSPWTWRVSVLTRRPATRSKRPRNFIPSVSSLPIRTNIGLPRATHRAMFSMTC
jgi:dimethylglycine dehydrogenase